MARVFIAFLVCTFYVTGNSQSISINNTGSEPNGKAILDINSTSKGLLIPRMTTMQRLLMNPTVSEKGMMVYDISLNTFCIYDGQQWDLIVPDGGTNNGSGDDDGDWINSITDNNPNLNEAGIIHKGNVGIGHQFANYLLDIEGDTNRLLNVNLKSGSINTGGAYAGYFQVQGFDDRNHTGVFSVIGGDGDNLKTGHSAQILNGGDGVHRGFNAYLTGTGTGRKIGYNSYIGGNGANERFGVLNHLDGSPTGNAKHFGVQNILNANGGGTKYGVENTLYGQQAESLYGMWSNITTTGTGYSVGVNNNMANTNASNTSDMIGIQNNLGGVGQGARYGVFNSIQVPENFASYGVFNLMSGTNAGGMVYGSYNIINTGGESDHYGVYSSVVGAGDGKHYAGYFNAPGNANDYAAVFNEGNVVVNESGKNYDFRVESENDASIIYVDGDLDMVGFGTFSPERRMHVYGDQQSETMALIENISTDDEADGLEIRLNSATATNQFIVFKNASIPNPIGSISGNASGGVSFNITSDARLKQNIEPFKQGLEAIKQIGAYRYEMKSAPGISQVGFLAQELYKVYPFAVSGTPENTLNNPMMVDYSKMTPLLVSAIREQQNMIDAQNGAIEALNEKVAKMERMMIQLLEEK